MEDMASYDVVDEVGDESDEVWEEPSTFSPGPSVRLGEDRSPARDTMATGRAQQVSRASRAFDRNRGRVLFAGEDSDRSPSYESSVEEIIEDVRRAPNMFGASSEHVLSGAREYRRGDGFSRGREGHRKSSSRQCDTDRIRGTRSPSDSPSEDRDDRRSVVDADRRDGRVAGHRDGRVWPRLVAGDASRQREREAEPPDRSVGRRSVAGDSGRSGQKWTEDREVRRDYRSSDSRDRDRYQSSTHEARDGRRSDSRRGREPQERSPSHKDLRVRSRYDYSEDRQSTTPREESRERQNRQRIVQRDDSEELEDNDRRSSQPSRRRTSNFVAGAKLGTFDGSTNLETFLAKLDRCVSYFGWDEQEELFQ